MRKNKFLLSKAKEMFLDHLRDKNYAESTLYDYDREISKLIEWIVREYNRPVFLNEMGREDLENYLSFLNEKGCKASYRNRILYTFRSFFKFVERQEMGSNISKGIEKVRTRTKERQFLTKDEMEALLEAIDRSLIWHVTSFLYRTGMRIRACLNLTFDDLDFKNEIVEVNKGKGNKDRRIAMSTELKNELKTYLEEHRPEVGTEYIFVTKRSGSLSRKHYNQRLKEAVARTDIDKNISAHCIRHSTAVSLLKEGVDLATIQKILGHKNISTTSQYLHSNLDDVRDAVEVL